jgi:two-component system NtrC family response regulator
LSGASIPDEQFESELFGPARVAYTGTGRHASGSREDAVPGTVLIEDVDLLSSAGQSALLQCVEMSTARRPGAKQARRPGVRFVTSAGPGFDRAWPKAGFHDRLFFALGVVMIRVPPLRDRAADIIPLAKHFLAHYAQSSGRLNREFSERALAALPARPWPGNIDELRSTVERAVLVSVGRWVTLNDLGLGTEPASHRRAAGSTGRGPAKAEVEAALRATQGNVSRAADKLGVNRRKLQRLMRQFGIDRTAF